MSSNWTAKTDWTKKYCSLQIIFPYSVLLAKFHNKFEFFYTYLRLASCLPACLICKQKQGSVRLFFFSFFRSQARTCVNFKRIKNKSRLSLTLTLPPHPLPPMQTLALCGVNRLKKKKKLVCSKHLGVGVGEWGWGWGWVLKDSHAHNVRGFSPTVYTRSKTYKRLNRGFFNLTKQDRMQIFKGKWAATKQAVNSVSDFCLFVCLHKKLTFFLARSCVAGRVSGASWDTGSATRYCFSFTRFRTSSSTLISVRLHLKFSSQHHHYYVPGCT